MFLELYELWQKNNNLTKVINEKINEHGKKEIPIEKTYIS